MQRHVTFFFSAAILTGCTTEIQESRFGVGQSDVASELKPGASPCDDHNACTADTAGKKGACTHEALSDGAVCNISGVDSGQCVEGACKELPRTTASLKLFIQGFVTGPGTMLPALRNMYVTDHGADDTMVDVVTVELRQADAPDVVLSQATGLLMTDGTVRGYAHPVVDVYGTTLRIRDVTSAFEVGATVVGESSGARATVVAQGGQDIAPFLALSGVTGNFQKDEALSDDGATPGNAIALETQVLGGPDSTGGEIVAGDIGDLTFPDASGQLVWIVVNHRNAVQTWSASPVEVPLDPATPLSYDFSSDAGQAFGKNQVSVSGTWALFSGDVDGDGVVDVSDSNLIEYRVNQFAFGLYPEDLSGDGAIDLSEWNIMEANLMAFVSVQRP